MIPKDDAVPLVRGPRIAAISIKLTFFQLIPFLILRTPPNVNRKKGNKKSIVTDVGEISRNFWLE